MSQNSTKNRSRRQAQTLAGSLRQFLTPEVWKDAYRVYDACGRRRADRWTLQPLVYVILALTWCLGDSLPERFVTARAFYIQLHAKRQRPGQTLAGFHKALAQLPLVVLRTLAAGIRRRLRAVLGGILTVGGFIPLGCDGSRVQCPRTVELEQRLGQAGQSNGTPQVWVTAVVHLATGLLWSWRCGKGDANEREHLRHLLPTLPPRALLVTDAGYPAYELAQHMIKQGVAFLMRVSSSLQFYSDALATEVLATWQDGEVYWWPKEVRERRDGQPLRVRLLRVQGQKHDVWLITSVLDATQLPVTQAGQFYRWRWENEGFFRSYKRTLRKVKLNSRTVTLVHREVEGSLLAVQLLLAQGAGAVATLTRRRARLSVRQLVLLVRGEISGQGQGQRYRRRVAGAVREQRQRRSAKEARVWPNRKPHEALKPPKVRNLTPDEKRLLDKRLETK